MTKIRRCAILASILLGGTVSHGYAQTAATYHPPFRDSVVVQAGPDYAAGSFERKMLGDNYRDLWTTPIKVPVLDITTFAGGITPLKTGGGEQGANLHFATKDSAEWVFRPVHKSKLGLSDQYRRTIIWSIFRSEGSASHPTSAAASDPLMDSLGVLHPHPILVVLRNDKTLGEFQKEFGGMLGWIEELPNNPRAGPAFANAAEIKESEKLLEDLNKDPETRIDERNFLTVRLLDMVLGDNDRHPLQWKWARLAKAKDSPWEPIARDRDKVFLTYQGFLLNLARKAMPHLVTFDSVYPAPSALFTNAMEQDRRLLGNLDKSVWDSTAKSIQQTLTNAVIDDAVRKMPREYAASSQRIAAKLRARRDRLVQATDLYYATLWNIADVHGSDAADRATITRLNDGSVRVQLQSGGKAPYFDRTFFPQETKEIRVYLHDGDDTALVTGNVPRSIELRVIGGNGNNSLVDASTVGGQRNPTRLRDVGIVSGVIYARDTAAETVNPDLAINNYFNRRPWLHAFGTLIPPVRDRGSSTEPIAGVHTGRGLGLVPRIGMAKYFYGFRKIPYASMYKAELAWATTNRFEVALGSDKRFEATPLHIPMDAKATQLEVVQFHGLGNDIPDLRTTFFHVKQTQWSFRPALGIALNNVESDLSIGPVLRYTTTDSLANRFISQTHPYGFPHFGEAGLQLRMHLATRIIPDTLKPRGVFDFSADGYPGIWGAKTAYQSIAGTATAFLTIPVPKRPVLVLHGGGKKLYGNFPYFDAAFLGGSNSLRSEDRQRFAGDAAAFGSAELRVPVAQFPLVVPLDVGLLGFFDAGRVYVNGDSPGGWHKAKGVGFWVGLINPRNNLNVLFTDNRDRRVLTSLGFAF